MAGIWLWQSASNPVCAPMPAQISHNVSHCAFSRRPNLGGMIMKSEMTLKKNLIKAMENYGELLNCIHTL